MREDWACGSNGLVFDGDIDWQRFNAWGAMSGFGPLLVEDGRV